VTGVTAPPPAIGPSRGPIVGRLAAALFLRREFYEQAAADPTATGPSGAALCLIALVRESVSIYELAQVERVWGLALPVVVILALLSWLLMAAAAWLVARQVVRPPVDYRTFLRCLGFAQAPTMLIAFAYVLDPALYLAAHVLLIAWALAALVVAMRAATAVGTGRAVLLALPVFLVQQLLLAVTRL
jgi:hypothetical protein